MTAPKTALPGPEEWERGYDWQKAMSDPVVVATGAGFTAGGFPFVRASTVKPETVEWRIPHFLPKGALVDVSGDPGVGKTSVLISWAASLSLVEPVILATLEDGLGTVIRRQLEAEGADMDSVYLYDTRSTGTVPSFPLCLDPIERLVSHTRAGLVGLDPSLNFMDANLDSHKQQDALQFTVALNGLAQRTGATVVALRHHIKAKDTAAIHKAAGSIAFTAQARVVLQVTRDRETGHRTISTIKNRYEPDRFARTFQIVAKDKASVIAWGEETTADPDELVNQDPRPRKGREPEALEGAKDFLRDALSETALQTAEAVALAKKQRISRGTLYRAATAIGAQPCTVRGKTGWRLEA